MSYAIDLIPRKGADKISCGQYGVCRWLTLNHFFTHIHDYDEDYSRDLLELLPHNLKQKGLL